MIKALLNAAKTAEELRVELIFNEDHIFDDLSAESEQYFLLALSALDQANRFFKLASIKND
jgi:hypothetical protein